MFDLEDLVRDSNICKPLTVAAKSDLILLTSVLIDLIASTESLALTDSNLALTSV